MWVVTPPWLSGLWRSFLYSSSVYSCHFLISSVLWCPYHFCPLYAHLYMKCSLVSLIFLKRSLVFPILLFSSISLYWSLRKAFLCFITILWNSAFKWAYLFSFCLSLCFFSQLFVMPPQPNFAFLHFFFLGMVLITASCTMSWTSLHSSSGTLSIIYNPLNLSLPLYNCKGSDLGHTWMV